MSSSSTTLAAKNKKETASVASTEASPGPADSSLSGFSKAESSLNNNKIATVAAATASTASTTSASSNAASMAAAAEKRKWSEVISDDDLGDLDEEEGLELEMTSSSRSSSIRSSRYVYLLHITMKIDSLSKNTTRVIMMWKNKGVFLLQKRRKLSPYI